MDRYLEPLHYVRAAMLHLLCTCYVLKPMNQTATPRRIGIIIADAAHNKPTFREYFAGGRRYRVGDKE